MIDVSDRLDQADACAVDRTWRPASQPKFHLPFIRQGILGGMVLLCLAGAGPLVAEDLPQSSDAVRDGGCSPAAAGGKKDRVPQPPAPELATKVRQQMGSPAGMSVEERIEQAFALPPPQIGPRLKQWAAAVSAGGLNPQTAVAASDAGDPTAPRRQLAGRAPIATFPLVRRERVAPPQERLGGGYLSALAPFGEDREGWPEMELDKEVTGSIPPGMPAEVPTPTPRPADVPVAALALPEPAAKAPARPRQPAETPAPGAKVSRSASPAEKAPAARQSPRAEASTLELPASLLPTRPPLD